MTQIDVSSREPQLCLRCAGSGIFDTGVCQMCDGSGKAQIDTDLSAAAEQEFESQIAAEFFRSPRGRALMDDGLYKIGFRTRLGSGYGVVVLQGGRIIGGDSSSFYVGSYVIHGARFKASLQLDRHTIIPVLRSVFGVERARIELEGDILGQDALMSGSSPDAPEVSFEAVMSRLA
ncbi:hypothetical protein [Brevundimonas phoenicis]